MDFVTYTGLLRRFLCAAPSVQYPLRNAVSPSSAPGAVLNWVGLSRGIWVLLWRVRAWSSSRAWRLELTPQPMKELSMQGE